MKKIVATTTSLVSWLAALPALAVDVNYGFPYITETGLGTRDIRAIIMAIVNVILGFLGIVAIIVILYGGFMWMTAAGNEDKVAQAKRVIIAGVIGLIIVLAAAAITMFVVNIMVNVTTV